MSMFNAVSSSARQLYLLLRCINLTPKVQIQISSEGLRFSVDEARTMRGHVFLDKSLFTSYQFSLDEQPPASTFASDDSSTSDNCSLPTFQISLPALLETLQVFANFDPIDRWSSNPYSSISSGIDRGTGISAFDSRVLGLSGSCRLSWASSGNALRIVMSERNITTACRLTAYEPETKPNIPFNSERLAHKIIMRAAWLHDAIAELAATEPERLTILASPDAPHFALSAVGPLGSATVAFSKNEPVGRDDGQVTLLETFLVPRQVVNTYPFALLKAAARAMAVATKVSIRADVHGVLSVQLMVEIEGGGFTFVDFQFVPLVPRDEEGENENEDDISQ